MNYYNDQRTREMINDYYNDRSGFTVYEVCEL